MLFQNLLDIIAANVKFDAESGTVYACKGRNSKAVRRKVKY